jgi:hypothetical protein
VKVRTLVSIVTASLLAVLLLVPGGAAAATKPASRQTPPSIDQKIVEQGSNGFYISVNVHDRRHLELSATRFERDLAVDTATYKMPLRSPSGPTAIEARLGRLGRIDMRFVSEKVKEAPPPGSACKGGKVVEEEGLWVGLLAFHGEHGFTQVRVHSALGTVTKTPPLRCRREGRPTSRSSNANSKPSKKKGRAQKKAKSKKVPRPSSWSRRPVITGSPWQPHGRCSGKGERSPRSRTLPPPAPAVAAGSKRPDRCSTFSRLVPTSALRTHANRPPKRP